MIEEIKKLKGMTDKERFEYLIESAYFSNDEFLIHDTGVYQLSWNKFLEMHEWKMLHDSFVLPIEFLQLNPKSTEEKSNNNDQINETYVRVLFKSADENKNKNMLLRFDEFDNICRSKLCKTDWMKPPRFERAFQVALQSALKLGQKEYIRHDGKIAKPFVEKKRCFNTKGWVTDDAGNDFHIRDNHPQFVGNVKPRTARGGSAIVCVNTFKAMMNESDQTCVEMAWHAASYTRGYLRITSNFSPMLVKHGKPGAGKSTSSLMMNAIECRPEKGECLFVSYKTSHVAFERLLADYTNGPVHIDEIDLIGKGNPDDTAEAIINICDGTPRSVADSDVEYTKGRTHKSGLIGTANQPLSEVMRGAAKAEAAKDRILELDFLDPDIPYFKNVSLNKIEEYHTALLSNYGHIYPLFIDCIIKNKEDLDTEFLVYENEIDLKHKSMKERYRVKQMIAFLRIGADIVGKVFGEEYGKKCHSLIDIIQKRKCEEAPETIENFTEVKIMTSLKEWILANKTNFEWATFAYCKNENNTNNHTLQKEHAKYLTEGAHRKNNGIFGVITLDRPMLNEKDFEGNIVIYPSGQDNMKRVHKIIPRDVKSAAEKLDLAEIKRLSPNQRKIKKQFLENNIFDELASQATSALFITLTDYTKFIVEESVDQEAEDDFSVSSKDLSRFTEKSPDRNLISDFETLKSMDFIDDEDGFSPFSEDKDLKENKPPFNFQETFE